MAKKPKNQNTEINNAANALTEILTEQIEAQAPAEQADANDASTEELSTQELDTHEQLVEKALQNPAVQAAYDEQEEEFNALEEKLRQQSGITASALDEAEIAPPEVPVKIKILKNFRIEMPLPGRKDVSVTLSLKKDQEISDPKVIKHVLKSDAQFIVL
jgi:hypothetical protein